MFCSLLIHLNQLTCLLGIGIAPGDVKVMNSNLRMFHVHGTVHGSSHYQ
jgi:hypothetical protein